MKLFLILELKMQILDRIFRIIKSNTSDYSDKASDIFSKEDDELKRIIDELNNDSKDNSQKNSNTYKQENIPSDILMAYNILGVNYNASIEQIKSAYKSRMKEYHPDKFARVSNAERKKAETKAKDINEAFAKLRKHKGF